MKRGMTSLSGEAIFNDRQVATLRMFLASLVLLPFAIRALRKIKNRKQVISLLIVGYLGSFFPAYLFTWAETALSSGYAGMLNSFTPIFTLIIGALVFRTGMTLLQIVGVLIGTLGMVSLMNAGQDLYFKGSIWHILAIVLATFFYAISLNTIKHTLHTFRAIEITALAFLFVFPVALTLFFAGGSVTVLRENPHAWEGFGFIAILAVVGTSFAIIIFNRLIALSSALFASTTTYFIPIVAVFIGLFFNERINLMQVVSMLIVLGGVFVANYWPQLRKRLKLNGKNQNAA